ncbi:MAG: hypothetical protein JXB04_00920 [Kiritimatiellae bacterium]|nr:hypothetical protein [Kiritimatiellia bacterium]
MRPALSAVFCFLAAAATAASPGFERYQVILDRKPFGEAPPPEVVVKPLLASESFARNLRLCALLEVEDGGLRAGIVDQQTKESFFLSEGEVVEGIELVSADYENDEAVIRKGSEMAVLKMNAADIQPLGPAEQEARVREARSRPSYAERRRAREERRRQPPPEPKYKGEELERHLQEYQMEVIRQGLPPLPIPLTEEMDDQLVAEGVLPPVE